MNTKNYIVIFIFLITGISFAQTKLPEGVELKKECSNYFIDHTRVNSILYKFFNNSKQPVWLWIERTSVSNLSDDEKIRSYFLKKDNGDDASLYQIGMDGSVGTFIPTIFKTFVKCISPNDIFSIQIISKKHIKAKTKQKVFSYFDKRILIYTEKDMTTHIPDINKMAQIVFYKADSIVLYLNTLKL